MLDFEKVQILKIYEISKTLKDDGWYFHFCKVRVLLKGDYIFQSLRNKEFDMVAVVIDTKMKNKQKIMLYNKQDYWVLYGYGCTDEAIDLIYNNYLNTIKENKKNPIWIAPAGIKYGERKSR